MIKVSEAFASLYRARREVSDPADLARLFLARLFYPSDVQTPSTVANLIKALQDGNLKSLSGSRSGEFVEWLRNYLVLGQRSRGVSLYPIHPVLSRALNRDESRVDGFVLTLIKSFSAEQRQQLFDDLWGNPPPFEKAIYDLVEWQIAGAEPMPWVALPEVNLNDDPGLMPASAAILNQTREDLIALAGEVSGTQSFVDHAGRLLALALARFFLAQAQVDMQLPIYIAPAADSHEGVRALAHEAIEVHRALHEKALRRQFQERYAEAAREVAMDPDPSDVAQARALTTTIFDPRANIVPRDNNQAYYDYLRREYGDLGGVSYFYYWQHSGASSRFLRQLYTAQLNMVKKAGIANSRSQYSTWHYYWLAPALVETLLLVSRPRLQRDQMLVADLLRDWRDRYRLALLIDSSWEDVYQASFRGLGNPESLNEANQRRFNEMLAERGRLRKNSDDFPWVILKD